MKTECEEECKLEINLGSRGEGGLIILDQLCVESSCPCNFLYSFHLVVYFSGPETSRGSLSGSEGASASQPKFFF